MGVGNEATQVGGSGLRAAHFARIGENALGPTQGPDGNSVTVTVTVTGQLEEFVLARGSGSVAAVGARFYCCLPLPHEHPRGSGAARVCEC